MALYLLEISYIIAHMINLYINIFHSKIKQVIFILNDILRYGEKGLIIIS